MNVRYRVELSQAERDELAAMLSKGKRAVRKLKRAQILLAAPVRERDSWLSAPSNGFTRSWITASSRPMTVR